MFGIDSCIKDSPWLKYWGQSEEFQRLLFGLLDLPGEAIETI